MASRFPPPYAFSNFDSKFCPIFTVIFPCVSPLTSFPPKTLAFGRLLPSTLIVALPLIFAEIVFVPFPPANTLPVIFIVFELEAESWIFTVTFWLIVPCELPPYALPYILTLLSLSQIFTIAFPDTLVLSPYPPPNNISLSVLFVVFPSVPPVIFIVEVVYILPSEFEPPYTAPLTCPFFTLIVVEPYILFLFAPPNTFPSIVPPRISIFVVPFVSPDAALTIP